MRVSTYERLRRHEREDSSWPFHRRSGAPGCLRGKHPCDQELLRNNLDIQSTVSTDSWLWTHGFWFDLESFILLLNELEHPVISIGLPSMEGIDSLLIVDLPLLRLNQANMYD